MQNDSAQNFNYQNPDSENEVKMKYNSEENKSKLDPNVGEYVDFEEITETNKTESDEK